MTKETTGDPKPSMEDTVREAYRAMGKPDVSGEAPEVETPGDLGESGAAKLPEEGSESKDPKSVEGRDEKGRFAKKDDKKATPSTTDDPTPEEIAAAEAELLAEEQAQQGKKPEQTPPAPVVDPQYEKAPSSWRGEAQQLWKDVPAGVKAEIYRREENFHRGIEGYRQMADIGNALHTEIAPYEAMIRAANTTPQALVRDFFNTAYILKSGTPEQKAQTVVDIMQEYGIDYESLTKVADALAAGTPVVDPQVASLRQENEQIKQYLQQQETERNRATYAEITSEVQQFAQATNPDGTLKYPHFETVRAQMAAQMDSGQAKTYEEAYNNAVWSHPDVRGKLLAEQQAADRKRRAEKVARAKKAAAVNVVKRGTPPATEPVGTMDDTIRREYRKLTSR